MTKTIVIITIRIIANTRGSHLPITATTTNSVPAEPLNRGLHPRRLLRPSQRPWRPPSWLGSAGWGGARRAGRGGAGSGARGRGWGPGGRRGRRAGGRRGGARSGLRSSRASLAAPHPAPPGALAASAVRGLRLQPQEEPRALR